MRQIKFRVWNGAEMIYDVMVGKFGAFYINPSNNGLDEKDSASLTPFNTKYHEGTPVMQFTGLKDKEGKEIWEGDIVRGLRTPDQPIRGGYLNIQAAEKYFEFRVIEFQITDEEVRLHLPKDISYSERNHENQIQWEIVGNIYKNPEMIPNLA